VYLERTFSVGVWIDRIGRTIESLRIFIDVEIGEEQLLNERHHVVAFIFVEKLFND